MAVCTVWRSRLWIVQGQNVAVSFTSFTKSKLPLAILSKNTIAFHIVGNIICYLCFAEMSNDPVKQVLLLHIQSHLFIYVINLSNYALHEQSEQNFLNIISGGVFLIHLLWCVSWCIDKSKKCTDLANRL